jgi:hypothetical protein
MPCGEDVAEALTVAVRFEAPLHIVANGNGHSGKDERRASPRRPLALPIQVRPERMPWFEEAMTVDVSLEGVRFLSTREYEPGHQLLVSFDPSSTPPWHGARVFRSRVVRVEPVPESSTLAVTVCRLS